MNTECQSRCNMRAEKLGQKIKYLRKLLNAFPRYSSSLIIGPDVLAFKTNEEKQYLLKYFNSIGSIQRKVLTKRDYFSH